MQLNFWKENTQGLPEPGDRVKERDTLPRNAMLRWAKKSIRPDILHFKEDFDLNTSQLARLLSVKKSVLQDYFITGDNDGLESTFINVQLMANGQ